MTEFSECGWCKQHRALFGHPVWKRPPAAMTFQWLIAAAAHQPMIDRSFGRPVELERGQLVTSLAELAGWVPFSVKQIRTALAYLEREKMIVREECHAGNCTLVGIVNYGKYQGREADEPLHGEERSGEAAGDDLEGQADGHSKGQTESGEKGKPEMREKPLSRNGKSDVGEWSRASRIREKGQAKGQADGQAEGKKTNRALSSPSTRARAGETVVEEVKEIINPPTPFKKGGCVGSDSSAMFGNAEARREMVLAMWREECAAAGLPTGIEGKATGKAVRALADEWLGQARMTVWQLREGMKKLLELKKSEPKCRLYSLAALARNPDSFCPPPPIEKPKRKMVRWKMVCDVCGHSRLTEWFPEGTAEPAWQGCVNVAGKKGRFQYEYCQGNMAPAGKEEREA